MMNISKKSKENLVYFSPERKFYKLTTFDDLRELLRKCDKQTLEALEKEFELQTLLPLRDEQALETTTGHLEATQLMLW